VGLGRLVAGIVGSNPASGMDVCPRPSMLCCPVRNQSDQTNRQTEKEGKKGNKERKKEKGKKKKSVRLKVPNRRDVGSIPVEYTFFLS
jgi:hypothetical protein